MRTVAGRGLVELIALLLELIHYTRGTFGR